MFNTFAHEQDNRPQLQPAAFVLAASVRRTKEKQQQLLLRLCLQLLALQ